jgi:hypothetical protein
MICVKRAGTSGSEMTWPMAGETPTAKTQIITIETIDLFPVMASALKGAIPRQDS